MSYTRVCSPPTCTSGVGEGGLEPPTSCSQSRCATTALLPETFGPLACINVPDWRSGPSVQRSKTVIVVVATPTKNLTAAPASVGDMPKLAVSFSLYLRAANRSPRTINSYLVAHIFRETRS